jgi:hypothetical protein
VVLNQLTQVLMNLENIANLHHTFLLGEVRENRFFKLSALSEILQKKFDRKLGSARPPELVPKWSI